MDDFALVLGEDMHVILKMARRNLLS